MIRVVIYLLIVAGLACAAVWFADRPGEVAITWQGWRVDTSVMVLAAAVAAVVVAAVLLWSLIRALIRSPDVLSLYLRTRRGVRGYQAVSQGLVAVASGDVRAARKFADEATRIAPGEPLTLLLGAQAAQLSGDRPAAERAFHVMANRDDTRLLGLHGLYIEAQRRDDPVAARLYAEEAAAHAAPPAWAGQAALEFRCASGDWTGALERLERNHKSGLVDKPSYRRQRAVLLTARALALEETDRARAREFALEAVRLAPALVPAAALAGRLLGEGAELRKAARVIEAAWRENPHPDLADAYAHLRPGDSARERLARIETLAAKSPGNIEGALAVARAALDAREFAVARAALRPLAIVPTRRVAALMAELEESRARRRGPRPRVDGARALLGAARSGLDRRRLRLPALAAGVAGDRPARRLRVEGSALRPRPRRHDRGGEARACGVRRRSAPRAGRRRAHRARHVPRRPPKLHLSPPGREPALGLRPEGRRAQRAG